MVIHMENNVFVNRCSPSCRARASPSCLSLSECSCRTGTICEACTFRFGLQDAVLAANREASPSDAAGELLEESIFAGPHPIDALMTWYHCSANIAPFQDGRAPNRSGNGKRYRDRTAYSWMGYKKSSQQPFDIRQTLSNREVYECALAVILAYVATSSGEVVLTHAETQPGDHVEWEKLTTAVQLAGKK